MVWIDFVIKGTDADYYYSTANLHEIRINRIDGAYPGYDVTKDAFSAQENLDLIPYANERFAEISSYASIRPAHTEAAYGLYFPMGYNVYYSVPDAFEAGVGYTFDVVETVEQKEAILASDYVFVRRHSTTSTSASTLQKTSSSIPPETSGSTWNATDSPSSGANS